MGSQDEKSIDESLLLLIEFEVVVNQLPQPVQSPTSGYDHESEEVGNEENSSLSTLDAVT